MNEKLWQQTVDFHGHICPGIAVGFRASVLALAKFERPVRKLGETHIAICENNVCGVDGVQFVTGCTLGNDGLLIDNKGKFAFSWVNKKSGKGLRIILKAPLWLSNEPLRLHRKVKEGTATAAEKERFFELREKRGNELMELADKELLEIQELEMQIPGKPRLFPFVTCARCGEPFMEPWAGIEEGQIICKACR
ncbi:MAG: FmdE family protein [Dethiobacteria bacterium]|jgi:formylmethanofuran dehydrogenase subunit E